MGKTFVLTVDVEIEGMFRIIQERRSLFKSLSQASLIRRLESDRQPVRLLGENSRAVVEERYSWDVRVREWLRFIESNLPERVAIGPRLPGGPPEIPALTC